MRSLQQIFADLPTTPETGLKPEAIADSRAKFGANRLTPLPREPLWKKFLEKFDEPIIKILLAAALLSMLVDLFEPPVEAARYAAGGIALGLAVAAVVAAYVLGAKAWVPSILFVAALVLFPIGIATRHPSYDCLAV